MPRISWKSNSLDEKLEKQLDSWISEFSVDDVKEIKSIEKETNHDVKAVEYFLKRKARESDNTFLKIMLRCSTLDVHLKI